MQYSNTTLKNGLLQSCEFWAGFNDGDITDDPTLKAIFTNRLNRRMDYYMGLAGARSQAVGIDDLNYTSHTHAYFDLIAGQHDYKFLEDEDGNNITEIISVLILESPNGKNYKKLDRLTLDFDKGPNENAELILSPTATQGGIPTRFIEKNNIIFLDPSPNYTAIKGGKVFFKRAPSYFVVSDTTKEPGILPDYLHEMLAVGAAYDWILVNKSNATTLITRTEKKLKEMEDLFLTYIDMRNPTKGRLIPFAQNNR